MLLDLIFPKKCLECGKGGVYICSSCLSKVGVGVSSYSNISIFKYEGVVRRAIIALKYKYATSVADELVSLLVTWLVRNKKQISRNCYLVPIPLHKKRENMRGFNQIGLIGKKLAGKMDWKFLPDLLIRTRQTTPQVQLKGSERRKSLSGVFKINTNCVLSTNSYVLLFDDVFTTGSTINEAKKVLTEAGFKNVRSLTIAR